MSERPFFRGGPDDPGESKRVELTPEDLKEVLRVIDTEKRAKHLEIRPPGAIPMPVRRRSDLRAPHRSEFWDVRRNARTAWWAAGGVLLVWLLIVVFRGGGGGSGGPVVRPSDGAELWRDALRDGDGHTWEALSRRDKVALCTNAAKALGHGDRHAWTYFEFLSEFYSKHSSRDVSISEAIAVCQAWIDGGFVELE